MLTQYNRYSILEPELSNFVTTQVDRLKAEDC